MPGLSGFVCCTNGYKWNFQLKMSEVKETSVIDMLVLYKTHKRLVWITTESLKPQLNKGVRDGAEI